MVSPRYENGCVFANSRVVRKLCCKSGKHTDLAVDQKKRRRKTERCSDDVGAATGLLDRLAIAAAEENQKVRDP